MNRLCGFKLTNAPEWVGLIGLTWESALDNGMPYFLTGTVRSESERRTSTQAVDDTGARLADDIQDANSKPLNAAGTVPIAIANAIRDSGVLTLPPNT